MKPVLTEQEIDSIHPMEMYFLNWRKAFAREIEKAVLERAYRRAAEVCEKEANDVHNIPGALVARRCRDAILALLEEEE